MEGSQRARCARSVTMGILSLQSHDHKGPCRAFSLWVTLILGLAACAAPQSQPTLGQAPTLPQDAGEAVDPADIAKPIHIAVALPLSGPQSRLGGAMARAVQMAFFQAQDPRLNLKFFDTQGSEATPLSQLKLRQAITAYAPQAVIGPLFSANAQKIAPSLMAQGVPVLSFSNDMAANAAGAILLGQQPEQEVTRVIDFVASDAPTRQIGLIVPDDVYGMRVRRALFATIDVLNEPLLELREAIAQAQAEQNQRLMAREFAPLEMPVEPLPLEEEDLFDGEAVPGESETALLDGDAIAPDAEVTTAATVDTVEDALDMEAVSEPQPESLWPSRPVLPVLPPLYAVVADESYPRNLRELDGPVRRIAQFEERIAEVETERAFLAELDDPMGLDYLDSIRNIETFRQPSYDILLVGEGGQMLRALAPMLNVYAIDEKETQLIGTGLWNDPALSREPALHGGLFAAPPADVTERFVKRYVKSYGARPPALAAAAYDAMTILALAARDDSGMPSGFETARLFRPQGFQGASGLFRILPSGISERTLSVMKITESGLETVEEAAKSFPPIEVEPEDGSEEEQEPVSEDPMSR